MRPGKSDERLRRADLGPGRAELRLRIADLRPWRADSRPGRADIRSGRADIKTGSAHLRNGSTFWAAASKGRCFVEHREELLRSYVHPPLMDIRPKSQL